MKKKKIIFALCAIIFLFSTVVFVGWYKSNLKRRVKSGDVRVGRAIFHTEIASDPEARVKGLSGRVGFPENGGMLFLFPEPGVYSFWMKDMRFSIDILWIENGKVVFLKEEFQPSADSGKMPVIVTPSKSADAVLEIPAGSIRRFGIAAGAPVSVHIPSGVTVR